MIKHNLRLNSLVKAIVLAGIILTTTQPVLANKKAIPNTPSPAVEFVSSGETGTVITVQYNNEQKQKFTLLIRDEAGNTVYRKEYDTENFAKTFQLVNESDEANSKFSLVIVNNDGTDFNFDINTSFSLVKKVEVNKL